MAIISCFWKSICFAAHVCQKRKDKHIKTFFLCCIMRNLQQNLNIISQPHISRPSPTPQFCLASLHHSPFVAAIFTKGGGGGGATVGFELRGAFTLCMVLISTLSPLFLYFPYNSVPCFESKKYHPTP